MSKPALRIFPFARRSGPRATVGFFVVGLLLVGGAAAVRADEFDTLRRKWAGTLTGTGYDPANPTVAAAIAGVTSTANSHWSSLDKSATRTALWSDAASTTVSGQITTNYSRLRSMALAYATPGSALQGNVSLRADIAAGLDWLYANRYNETKAIYDNWWDFEIGTPMALVDTTILLHPDLTAVQIANYMKAVEKFTPSATTPAAGGSTGTFTGANRMWKIYVVALRGLIVKDAAKLAAARDAFSNLFLHVTSGDGFYVDGSFIQHTKHPYTGGYGASLLGSMAQILALLNGPNADNAAGSTWRVTDPNRANLYQWVYRAYEPLIYRGGIMAMVQGREVSRSSSTEHGVGQGIMQSILRVSQFAPPADADRMRSMVKHWAQTDTSRNFAGTAPLSLQTEVQQLLADPTVVPREELTGNFVFGSMDRVVHLRPGFGVGLSMSSTRVYTYESINSENLHGWHTGDGMLYLYNADLTQFTDNFWPTVNARRLPGTTVDAGQVRADGSGQSSAPATTWVGGATLGGHGAAGMQVRGWNSTLTARKSWFLLDGEIVCLGAGITSTDSRPIETIVENRLLNTAGNNAFIVGGTAKSGMPGWAETMTGVTWTHLAGRVADADLGYYFPAPATLKGLRETRTGAWSDVNARSGSTTPVARSFLTLWFDHGANPAGATYAYVLLPGRSAAQIADYAADPPVAILANSDAVQAVRKPALGLAAANFWNDGAAAIGGITVDKKACVLVQDRGAFLEVAVSDPTQANTGSITVELATAAIGVIAAEAGVTVIQFAPTVRLSVNVKGAAGRTFTARLHTGVSDTRLVNLSANTNCEAGTTVTAGFVIAGEGTQRVLVRAVGPGLALLGVPDVLADPRLVVNDLAGRRIAAANDNWSADSPQAAALRAAFAATGAFALTEGSRDAALILDLPPGMFTAEAGSAPLGQTGRMMIEVYRIDATGTAEIVNLSTRKHCPAGTSIVCGFVVGGTGVQRVLVRAVGPGLLPLGVTDFLPDPRLTLHDLNAKSVLTTSDNWSGDPVQTEALRVATAATGAFALADGSRDAALVVDLPPGAYTAEAFSAVPGQAGNLMVEIYAVR